MLKIELSECSFQNKIKNRPKAVFVLSIFRIQPFSGG